MNLSVPLSFKRCHRMLSTALMLILLAGCAQQAPVQSTNWQTHQYALEQLSHYQAKGKLGYKGPDLRFGANLLWKTAAQKNQLLLTNFLGSTLLKLDTTESGATLIDNNGRRHQGTDAATLVQQLTGINLPIEQMRDWLIGLPTAADTYQLNAQNTVSYLAKAVGNQTWEMTFDEYDYTTSPALPKKMVLTQNNQRITLIIHSWSLK
ncbi:lipoprotein insertase outer membrane protein LolB [Photobacterium sanguinicancri]|uniref:lipoprotein insertase outer membrane protein LolB n=1 Tax=Photobacterium sanguinicancri TaxID=875932 RepID=UPI003D118D51